MNLVSTNPIGIPQIREFKIYQKVALLWCEICFHMILYCNDLLQSAQIVQ